jgi:hypothetical protein
MTEMNRLLVFFSDTLSRAMDEASLNPTPTDSNVLAPILGLVLATILSRVLNSDIMLQNGHISGRIEAIAIAAFLAPLCLLLDARHD